MNAILPGVFHWTRVHPKIEVPVSSYWLVEEGVLIDPLVPDEGLEEFVPPPRLVYLTNRHHYRESGRFAERFGCEVRCAESGLHEFTHGEEVRPFRFGEELPGGLVAVEIGALCPDETALLVAKGEGFAALGDGVIRDGDGPLAFVPDAWMGEDPAEVKEGLRRAYRRLLERDFEHLLLGHGDPWIGGREALRALVEG